MPAVEKIRGHLNTALIFLHRAFQFADSQVAVRVIKDVLERLHAKPSLLQIARWPPAAAHAAIRKKQFVLCSLKAAFQTLPFSRDHLRPPTARASPTQR